MQKYQKLSSKQVQYLIKIRKDKKFRSQEKKVLITGEKTILEISKKNFNPEMILSTNKSANAFYTDMATMKRITGLIKPQEMAAIFSMPKQSSLSKKKYILVLEALSDPGNLGTLVRSALALGFQGIILTPTSVDLFNDKALRSAKGTTFFLPFSIMTSDEILKFSSKYNFALYAADMTGANVSTCTFTSPLMLILSNEAHGLSNWAKKSAKSIKIPMKQSVESLNVAIAGSLLMYKIRNFS